MRKSKNIWITACISGGAAATVMTALTMLCAKGMLMGVFSVSRTELASYLVLAIASIFGAMLPVIFAKRKTLILCLIEATVFFLLVAILNGVMQRGVFHRIWQTILVIYLPALLVGGVGAGRKKTY